MAFPIRQPQDDEPLCEVGDLETGSETELLSGTDGAGGSATTSWRRWRTDRQGRLGLRACTAATCLGLAALFIVWNGVVFGPVREESVLRSTVNLDIEAETRPATSKQDPSSRCQEDEEFFGGLCYKKCMYLTDGYYPIRTSAMTCCESHPCGLFNQKHDVGFCSGFSVAGGKDGACPHPPGSCLPDEEMLVGQCYKKCSLLTDGKYNHRTAPGTCCNQDNALLCLLPKTGYSKTDPSFDVGGGTSTKVGFHVPAPAATNAARSTSAAAFPSATTTMEGVEQQITQPPLPDWYVEMQKARQGGQKTTTKAPTSVAVEQVTPPPVPDWAQAATATRAAVTATVTTKTHVPTSLAPTTTAKATTTPHLQHTTSVAAQAALTTRASQAMLPRTTSQPISTDTTASLQGTTVPEWLREIVAEPEVDEEATRMPTSVPSSSEAPASTPAPTASSTIKEAHKAHAVQVARMPDWAQEMLNEDESPSPSEQAHDDGESGA